LHCILCDLKLGGPVRTRIAIEMLAQSFWIASVFNVQHRT
jgi:hypothetical protein